MPELPEVETVVRGLNGLIIDKKVVTVKCDNPKSFPNDQSQIDNFLIGAKVRRAKRRAKLIIIDLSTDYSLVVHLKMTGQLVYKGEQNWGAGHPNDSLIGQLPDKSTRVIIEFADQTKLYFNDQRKFGWMKLLPTVEVAELAFVKKLGPEPLADDFSLVVFKKRLARKQRSNIKAAILDQTVLAGIGNIYADESLFLAGVHPRTLVGELTDQQLKKLHQTIRQVLQKSIDLGGSSSRNYVDATGAKGNYLNWAFVYKRDQQPCRQCQTPIEKIRVAGRGTHFCPICQPESRS